MTMLTRQIAKLLRPFAVMSGLVLLLGLGACGGGGTGGTVQTEPPPATTPPPAPLTILPPSATIYRNTPLVLTVSGGVAPYRIFSSDNNVVPVNGMVSTTGTFLIVANDVAADTVVTLTVQDSAGQTATATLTVRPASILNTLTITPTVGGGISCAPAICAGGDGTVTIALRSVTGAALPGRQVKFDVVQGNYSIQTGIVAQPSVNTLTVTSDQNGAATVRILAATNAPTQVALIRATDLTTGNQVTSSFTISQVTSGEQILSVLPTTATITGPDNTRCSAGAQVTYYVFGGTPPYRVVASFPGTVDITGSPVLTNGGGFTVTTNGSCVIPLSLIITDATGRTVTATLRNELGTAAPPSIPFAVTPTTATLCPNEMSTFILVGGSGSYVAASSNPNRVTATVTGNILSVQRNGSDAGTAAVSIGVSDGRSTLSVAITTPAPGASGCPGP